MFHMWVLFFLCCEFLDDFVISWLYLILYFYFDAQFKFLRALRSVVSSCSEQTVVICRSNEYVL